MLASSSVALFLQAFQLSDNLAQSKNKVPVEPEEQNLLDLFSSQTSAEVAHNQLKGGKIPLCLAARCVDSCKHPRNQTHMRPAGRAGANPDLGHFFLTAHLTFIPSSFTSAELSSRTYFHTPDVFLIARPHASPTAGWMGSPAGGAWGGATITGEEAEPPPASSATSMRL